jgi:hypothetical protein
MRIKTFKLRGLATAKGRSSFVDLCLEFDGKRAFVVWDCIPVGHYEFKARLEIDPALLQKAEDHGWDYVYCGRLVLPRPENN